jgi:hypothetical protein
MMSLGLWRVPQMIRLMLHKCRHGIMHRLTIVSSVASPVAATATAATICQFTASKLRINVSMPSHKPPGLGVFATTSGLLLRPARCASVVGPIAAQRVLPFPKLPSPRTSSATSAPVGEKTTTHLICASLVASITLRKLSRNPATTAVS